jgi:hypothetical protein
VDGIPAFNVGEGRLVIAGDPDSSEPHSFSVNRTDTDTYLSASVREYTSIKKIGEGSFATVELCDWHGPLPQNTPISAMQRNVSARPEYVGRRLVAVKRLRRQYTWQECKDLKELQACYPHKCPP